MKKIKIILVDDYEFMNQIKYEYFSKLDYIEIVGIAVNGYEEINLIKSTECDVVITDNQMPYMNGTEVIEYIESNNEVLNKPKFIIVSADNLQEFARIHENVICAIRKNSDYDEINRKIEDELFCYMNM